MRPIFRDMQLPRLRRPPDYRAYREAVVQERVPTAVRTAAAIIFALNMAFLLLDAYAFPELFWNFLGARMALNASLAVAYLWSHRVAPRTAQLQLVLSAGALLLWVIYEAGAPTTEYYAGLMLLFLGFPLVLPLTVRETLLSYGAILSVFLVAPFLEPGFHAWETFSIHALFLGGGAFTGIASSRYLEDVRLAEWRQRKQVEEARDRLEEMDRVKSRFTANVHHELRTPLTLTLAPLESLLAGEFGPLAPVQRSYLETMHANALRLLKLINNLLDLAKIENQELEIRRRPVELSRLVKEIVQGAEPLAAKKGVSLAAEVGAVGEIHADPDALEKVLLNLLGNALKFTEPGDRIALAIAPSGDDGGVRISVRDTGVGLAPEQIERIFDRFAQVDASATRKHEGTGIGLSLCRELVALHGGRIWAESDGLGHGTAIHVWLPEGEDDVEAEEALLEETAADARSGRYVELERTIQRSAEIEPEAPVDAGEAGDRPSVLVCEDNADMRRLLRDLLQREFRVRVASNGRLGLEAVREAPPDLVLTDVMMPEMSGIELCEALKADPATEGIPVVLVTSKAEREMKIAGLERGADDYVTKPFHARELLARIRSLIRLRLLQEELADRNRVLEETNDELATALRELKETEARLVRSERLAAVGELAAGVAHEANNPVNFARTAVGTMASYLEDLRRAAGEVGKVAAASGDGRAPGPAATLSALEEAVEGIEELVGIAADGLERTGRLVGDLRDFAAPLRGAREPTDLAQTLASAVQLTRYSLQQQGVSLETEIQPGLPWVEADPRAIGQVVVNLLKNAAEAIEKPRGCVWLKAAADGAGIRVEVLDDGPGIDPAVRDRLFEPFFTTKPAGQGTGLGLSISRQVVEEHGGTLEVADSSEGGARVSFWLPLERVDDE